MKTSAQRLTYIDAMRGLACLLMFQTHCYDAWLGKAARATRFFGWSQFAGTLAAPSFLFLAGLSAGLAVEAMYRRGAVRGTVAGATVRRGANILGLALLFRVQEYLLGLSSAPWTDLLRVDILNVIGVSIVFIGIACWAAGERRSRGIAAAAAALGIAMLTPLVWNNWRPRWLPWFLESYVDGVHIFSQPQPWLFPIFPWVAFAFAGFALACFLKSDWAGRREGLPFTLIAAGGVTLAGMAWFFDALPIRIYQVYDFWHTSPNFFLARLSALLMILTACYWWARKAAGKWLLARLIELGQSSLLVYWVHIEFVYGGLSILPKRSVGIPAATGGLCVIVIAMWILSVRRSRLKERGTELVHRIKHRILPAGEFE